MSLVYLVNQRVLVVVAVVAVVAVVFFSIFRRRHAKEPLKEDTTGKKKQKKTKTKHKRHRSRWRDGLDRPQEEASLEIVAAIAAAAAIAPPFCRHGRLDV